MPELSDDLLCGANEAAKFTGLSRRVIYHLVETNAIPVTRIGKRLYFRRSELDDMFRVARPTRR